jgi:type II secretory pathway component PulF
MEAGDILLRMLGRVASHQAIVDFTKQLSVMLRSGITIDEALEELAQQASSARFRTVIERMHADIRSGMPLAQAFGKEHRTFGGVTTAIVRAGEASGTLEENLAFLADWLEHDNDIRREVHGAMIYPAIVFVATIGMSAGLTLIVLPKLLPIFSQMAVELPLPTKVLLALTSFLQYWWHLALVGLAGLIGCWFLLDRVPMLRLIRHRITLRVPFFGALLKQYQLTLIAQLFTTLFRSGLSITEIISIAGEGSTNLAYRNALRAVGSQIDRGTTLSGALRSFPELFPRNMLAILSVGEKSGTLEDSFSYLTTYFRKEVFTATKRLPTIIEPILLLIMGLSVAFIAIAIILPIYEFTSSVRR